MQPVPPFHNKQHATKRKEKGRTNKETMDTQRESFSRLSAQDQGMMESPHNTPAKPVRRTKRPDRRLSPNCRGDASMRTCWPHRVKRCLCLRLWSSSVLVFCAVLLSHFIVFSLWISDTSDTRCFWRRTATSLLVPLLRSERTEGEFEINSHAPKDLFLIGSSCHYTHLVRNWGEKIIIKIIRAFLVIAMKWSYDADAFLTGEMNSRCML